MGLLIKFVCYVVFLPVAVAFNIIRTCLGGRK
jgi:hypothetical protein